MKEIGFLLKNILNKKSEKLLYKKEIINIISLQTNITLNPDDIIIKDFNIFLKTKPIIKHKINLTKESILKEVNLKTNLNIINII